MSMCNTLQNPKYIRTNGCVVSESVTEAAREKMQQELDAKKKKHDVKEQIRAEAEKLAQETIKAEREKIYAAESSRREALEIAWNKTIESLKQEIQTQVIDMSIQIAEIILQHALPDGAMIKNILEETLAPLSDLQGLRVRMNPGDLANHNIKEALTAQHPDAVIWTPDPTLGPGDVIVESRNGIFDGRLKERLSMLKEAIANPAPHIRNQTHEPLGDSA